MFEKFSEPAMKVIMIAQQESRRLHHNFIGTEHLLLGLIGESNGVAAMLFTEMGITLDSACSEVQKLTGGGLTIPALEIPFSPRAKTAMETAVEISDELGHQYIGTGHLLLGIIQEGVVAFQVLENLGVEPLNLRDRILQKLSTEPQAETVKTPQQL